MSKRTRYFYYNRVEQMVHVLDAPIEPEELWAGVLVGSFALTNGHPPHPTFLAQTFIKNAGYPRTTGIEIVFQSPFV